MDSTKYGKRIKSKQAQTMWHRFPPHKSTDFEPDKKTLPAGKPSPKIVGYTKQGGGYYAVQGNKQGDYYIKDSEKISVVSENAQDESSFLYTATGWISDTVGELTKDASKPFYYAAKGFDQTIEDAKELMPFDNLKETILWVAVPVGGILLLMIINNFSE